jgi:hypothetical protein
VLGSNGTGTGFGRRAVERVGALVGKDGCEVRLCDPCARVRPCAPCVSRVCPLRSSVHV